MGRRENQGPISAVRFLWGVARWLLLAIALYVAAFQLMVLAIGRPETSREWLDWNQFLFAPGLEYPTAMQFFAVVISLLVAIPIGVWQLARSRRKRDT
jgi:hypothetical protein